MIDKVHFADGHTEELVRIEILTPSPAHFRFWTPSGCYEYRLIVTEYDSMYVQSHEFFKITNNGRIPVNTITRLEVTNDTRSSARGIQRRTFYQYKI